MPSCRCIRGWGWGWVNRVNQSADREALDLNFAGTGIAFHLEQILILIARIFANNCSLRSLSVFVHATWTFCNTSRSGSCTIAYKIAQESWLPHTQSWRQRYQCNQSDKGRIRESGSTTHCIDIRVIKMNHTLISHNLGWITFRQLCRGSGTCRARRGGGATLIGLGWPRLSGVCASI